MEDSSNGYNQKNIVSKNERRNHVSAYVFDFVAFVFLIVFTLLDGFVFKRIIKECGFAIHEVSASIIVLAPLVVTIISISLSTRKETIYGATLGGINGLRGNFYFTFFHMTLIFCSIIGTYSIMRIFDLKIAVYFLEFLALTYSVIFSIQEIPVLSHSKWAIRNILRKNYLKINRNNLPFEKENTFTFNIMITNIIFTEGIGTAYKLLDKKGGDEQDLLDYLLKMQNLYFLDVVESLSLSKNMPSDKRFDISIIDAANGGYNNILEFFTGNLKNNLIKKQEAKKYYQISKTLSSLHFICNVLSLQNKEKAKIDSMIYFFILHSLTNESDFFETSIVVNMVVITLIDGNTWFLKFLRDNTFFPHAIFNFEKCPIGIFAFMLIGHMLDKKIYTEKEQNEIKDFINEAARGANANGLSWTQLMKQSVEYGDRRFIASSLMHFLNYYKSVDENVFYFHGSKKRLFYNLDEEFTKRNVFHDWLLILFLTMNIDLQSIDLEGAFEKLSDDDKSVLADELSENWFEQGRLKEKINLSFLQLFVEEYSTNFFVNQCFNKTIDQLVKLHDDVCRKRFEKSIDAVEKLDEEKKETIEKLHEAIIKNIFYDAELSVEKESNVCFEIVLKGPEHLKLLKMSLVQLPSYFLQIINDAIKAKIGKIERNESTITDEIAEKIVDFKPEYTSSHYLISSYLSGNNNEKRKKELKDLNIKNVSGLYPGLFFKNEAIKFNAIIDEKFTTVRNPTSEELEKIIEQKYKPFDNGLYRYSKFEQDKKGDFYASKEELTNYLRNSIHYVEIVFKYKVLVNDKKIKTFPNKLVQIDKNKFK